MINYIFLLCMCATFAILWAKLIQGMLIEQQESDDKVIRKVVREEVYKAIAVYENSREANREW
uniref:Uncharacterized protein n=1 Tax=virus sp. ctBM815 TaxID=2825806 RepID=A0A8S5RJX9_9VIRU|nr:MAG TPA: hypothetical protein [virus sp. ctBM815]DAJ65304.1 MAG TPA: hypothetical protein [Bacteriophage sp.]